LSKNKEDWYLGRYGSGGTANRGNNEIFTGTEYRDAKAFLAFSAFFTRASLQSRNFLYITIINIVYLLFGDAGK
jgi:hypothetical protein